MKPLNGYIFCRLIKKSLFLTGMLISCSISVLAQPYPLSEQVYKALNKYLEYSNEMVHGLQIMHDEFVFLNDEFVQIVENKKTEINYPTKRIFTNYEYFPVLPADIYQDIFNNNVYIPFDKRGKPLQLVGKVNSVMTEIEGIRNEIGRYIRSGRYLNDSLLAKGFEWLRRVEVLYYDMYVLQEKLHWSISAILSEYQLQPDNPLYIRVLNQLSTLATQSKRLLRAVRAQDTSAGLSADCAKMRDLLNELKRNKLEYFSGIPLDEAMLYSQYDEMIQRGEALLNHTQDFIGNTNKHHIGRPHRPYYYYFNEDLLDNYNRYGDGMAALYNKLVKYTDEYVLWADELPPIFEVIYPEHSAFDSLRRDSLPDPEWFVAQLEKNRKDSLLRADSLRKLNNVLPEIGEPSLDGFATNNLILLVDVSASMDAPEKLPLLKASLDQLLDLMRPEDNITIISYSEKAEIVLSPTSAQYKDKIIAQLNSLSVRTSSDANKGVNLAYLVARESFIKNGNNRIILATDGNFKIDKKTQRNIKKGTNRGIKMSVFYFSDKEYSHVRQNLNGIAMWGKGRYNYITADNAEEALLLEAQSVRKKESVNQ